MKLSEIPGLMDWLKTLPQKWLDDPESWTMDNFYFIHKSGAVANDTGNLRPILKKISVFGKEALANAIKGACKALSPAAVVQATEGWATKMNGRTITKEEVMETYGDSPEAEAKRKLLGLERVHSININAQTDEESAYFSQVAYENPKLLGEVLTPLIVVPNHDGAGLFNNLLAKEAR